MNRVTLHLLASLLLGFALVGLAELAGRAEAQAAVKVAVSQPAKTLKVAVRHDASDSLVEHCWDLVSLSSWPLEKSIVTAPIVSRPQEATAGRALPFGWGYLPRPFHAG